MKNSKKFIVKALSKDDLSRIKGGAMNWTCEQAYDICSRDSSICYPNYGTPTPGWYDCIASFNPNCSPLGGWHLCE